MNLKAAAFMMAGLLILSGCVSSTARQVKTYQDRLEPMIGRDEAAVRRRIVEEFRFELLDRWKGENPDPETVLKNNFRLNGFSRREAAELFGIPGLYKVEVYLKRQAVENARIEQIDESGRTIPASRQSMSNDSFIYARVVFRDSVLIRWDVWSR